MFAQPQIAYCKVVDFVQEEKPTTIGTVCHFSAAYSMITFWNIENESSSCLGIAPWQFAAGH
jgi:hypothetical protein